MHRNLLAMTVGRKVGAVIVAAATFGALAALVKGQGGGVRDALGNISAPWLLLAFLAGTVWPRARVAALCGLGATLIALAAFYAAESVILDLGPHSWIVDLQLTFRGGHAYFVEAVLSGPIFGALGGIWARRRSVLAAAAIILAFVGEPLAVWLFQRRAGFSGGSGLLTHYPLMWASEIAIGLAGAIWVGARVLKPSS
jgi:hypothetical protein